VDELNRRLSLAVAAASPVALTWKTTQESDNEADSDEEALALSEEASGFVRRRRRRRRGPAPAPGPTMPAPPGLEFVDVRGYFKRGACRIRKKEVRAIVISKLKVTDASFHPSQRGYNKYYNALGDSLVVPLPPVSEPPEENDPEDLQHVLDGWDANGDGKLDMNETLAMVDDEDGVEEEGDREVIEQMQTCFKQVDRGDGLLDLPEFDAFTDLVANL